MKIIYYALFFIILCSACGPRIVTKMTTTLEPLHYQQEVFVLEKEDPLPDGALYLGQVKIGDNGFSKSNNYGDVIRHACEEARKAGGNVIQVVKHKHPDLWATTHRIQANIFHVEEKELSNKEEKNIFLTPNNAIIHLYRSNSMGSALTFDIYLGEQLLCRVKNNFKISVPVTSDGQNTLWVKTEKKSELPIRIEFGKEYYVRCSVSMGVLAGRAELELVNPKTGKMEFDAIESSF